MFKFDPNSTKNQGRWRLIDPNEFEKMWTEQNKEYNGISYIVGIINKNKEIQAIRFNKTMWTEKKARDWWNINKKKYNKTWTEKKWEEWIETKKDNYKRIKINRSKGLRISKDIADILNLEYISPRKIGIDNMWSKNKLLPVGSIRRGKEIIGDIDVIVTKQINKDYIKSLCIKKITDISGGEKRIDFNYNLRDGYVRINIFIFINPRVWGASLLHSSGPFMYNIRLRNKLHSSGWINKYGDGWKLSQNGLTKNGVIIDTFTEKQLQEKLEVNERKPKDRN